jgi:hypothetical protein
MIVLAKASRNLADKPTGGQLNHLKVSPQPAKTGSVEEGSNKGNPH